MIFSKNHGSFELKTVYSTQKRTKKENFTYLNKTLCLKNQTVLAGDSITEIFNSYEYFYEYSKENGQAVYNRGISGDTSDRLAERFYDNVLNIEPKNIVLLIGTNDIGLGADIYCTAKYINTILTQISECEKKLDRKINVILQAVYPVNKAMSLEAKRMVGRRSNGTIEKLNTLIKKSAEDYGCIFIDLADKLSDNNGNLNKNYCYDGLHLNAKGFEIVAENIIPLLK